jgi:hypothetical protein
VQVGGGRGFVVEREDQWQPRVIITAAHCLDDLPPAHPISYTEERTYPSMLGPLGAEPTVSAECLFADPIADIAVFGTPDSQDFSDEADAYESLLAAVAPLPVADAPKDSRERVKVLPVEIAGEVFDEATVLTPGQGTALVLSLSGDWTKCSVERRGPWLWIKEIDLIEPGMSGSPIVSLSGEAIGLVSTAGSAGSLNPVLVEALPPRIRIRRDDRPV